MCSEQNVCCEVEPTSHPPNVMFAICHCTVIIIPTLLALYYRFCVNSLMSLGDMFLVLLLCAHF